MTWVARLAVLTLLVPGAVLAAPPANLALPLHFEPVGQDYLARGPRYQVAVSPTGLRIVPAGSGRAVAVQLAGARPAALCGEDQLPLRVSTFRGRDPHGWRQGVTSFGRVLQRQAWPGIDLIYYGREGELEYDLLIAPGADPARFGLRVDSGVRIDSDGAVRLLEAPADLRLRPPVAWQSVDGRRHPVAASWTVTADGTLRFRLGAYDHHLPLVIDPVLTYASYVGGNDYEQLRGLAKDPAGNLWIVGTTRSTDLAMGGAPQGAFAGGMDIFVAKFSGATGQPLAATYLGGSGYDNGAGIAVDGSGNVYVLGNTSSTDLPVKNAVQATMGGGTDTVIASLDNSGTTLRYCTYWGGSSHDEPGGIAVDALGSVVVVGTTQSANAPVANALQATMRGTQDAYVLKLSAGATPTVTWATFLGGTDTDVGSAVALDNAGDVIAVGTAESNDFPLASPLQSTYGGSGDTFVSMLSPDGSHLSFSTYVGGSDSDLGYAVTVDPAGAIYIGGLTASPNFPLVHALPAGQRGTGPEKGFIAKLNHLGSALEYATTIGGSGNDYIQGLAVDSTGRVAATGTARSTNWPTANPQQSTLGGQTDAVLALLSADGGSLTFSTYYGGSDFDSGYSVLLDDAGHVDMAGSTGSSNLYLVNPARSTLGLNEGFLAVYDTHDVTPAGLAVYGASVTHAGNAMTQPLRVDGYGFVARATVKLTATGLADIVATGVQVAGDGRSLACTLDLRNQPTGQRTLTVTNPDTTSASLGQPFTVDDAGMRITSVSPTTGYAGENISLQINGTGLPTNAVVRLVGPATLVPTSVGTTAGGLGAYFSLSDLTPTGTYDLQVNDPNGAMTGLAAAFSVIVPAVTSVSPATADNTTTVGITVQGAGFRYGTDVFLRLHGSATLTMGTNPAITANGTQIAANMNLQGVEPGVYDVVIRYPNLSSKSLDSAFTITPGVRLDSIEPTTMLDSGRTTLVLHGINFPWSAPVTLSGPAGQDPITFWAYTRAIGLELGVDIDGTKLIPGTYTVTVQRTPGVTSTLPACLNVQMAPMTISGIVPRGCIPIGQITMRATGSGFNSQTGLKLVRAGHTDLTPQSTAISDDHSSVTALFNFADVDPGDWKVVIYRGDGSSVELANAFTVYPKPTPGTPRSNVYVDIGTDRIRMGAMRAISIKLTNNGTMDATGTLCIRGLPLDADWDLYGLSKPDALNWRDYATVVDGATDRTIILPRIRVTPGNSIGLWLYVSVPTERTFDLSAYWAG